MRTRQILLDAVKTLLEKHQFDDITVQDILNEAGVSRGTFYKYFTDKYDIVNTYFKDHISKEMICKYNGENYDEICLKIYNFIKENKKFYKNVISYTGQDSFCDFLCKYNLYAYIYCYKEIMHSDELSEEAEFKLDMIAQYSVLCIKKWVETDCSIPIETLLKWVKDISYDIYDVCKTIQNPGSI